MFYFNKAPYSLSSPEEVGQVGRVIAFKQRLTGLGALFWDYDGPDDFERKVRQHLTRLILSISKSDLMEMEERPVTAPPLRSMDEATGRYLEYLVDRYQYLDFKGMGISDRVPLRLSLMETGARKKAKAPTIG